MTTSGITTSNPNELEREIYTRFSNHQITSSEALSHMETVRSIMRQAAREIVRIIPPGRESSIVLTKLEEAMFFGVAAIARKTSL